MELPTIKVHILQKLRNTTNVFNAYKSGKLNGTPNLGDTFIDLNP